MAQQYSLDLESTSSQYAYIADAVPLRCSGDFTLEAWVKLETLSTTLTYSQTVMSKDASGAGWTLRIESTGNKIDFVRNGSTQYTGATALVTGVWYHIAVTMSSATIKIYLNGKEDYSGAYTDHTDATGQFRVGETSDFTGRYLDGLIKDVRVFSDARTAAEIVADARTESVSDGNLVAQWNFNNAYTDSSGSGYTLTSSGSPVFGVDIPWEDPDGVQSTEYVARLVAASSQYFDVSSNLGLSAGGAISMEGWFRLNTLPGSGVTYGLVHHLDATVDIWEYISYNNAAGTYTLKATRTKPGTSDHIASLTRTLETGRWYHVAMTYDATTIRLYLDGILEASQASASGGGVTATNSHFAIGVLETADSSTWTPNTATCFDGDIKEVRVFSDERTQAEIIVDAATSTSISNANLVAEYILDNALTDGSGNAYTLTNNGTATFVKWGNRLAGGLVSWWTLDEASGNRADSHVSANTLTDNNTVASATGLLGNAADFERSNSEYLSRADASVTGLDITGAFTISTWFKLESLPASSEYYMLVAKGAVSSGTSDANTQYALWYDNDSARRLSLLVRSTGANKQVTYTTTLNTGQWYHLVAVYNPSTSIQLYLDGAQILHNVTSIPASLVNTAQPFVIGAENAGTPGAYFDGLIDETAVYSRTLQYGDILDLYNAGVGITYTPTASAGGNAFFLGANF